MHLTITSLFLAAILQAPAVASERSDEKAAEALRSCAPKTYDQAVQCLDRFLPAESQVALSAPGGAIDAHFGLGLFVRNNWGLWKQGPLYAAMSTMGFTHPDDMSGAILEGFAARERGEVYRPTPPDPAKMHAEWDQAVKEGRAGSFACPNGPEPKNSKEAEAAAAACLDHIAKSLGSDPK